MKSQNVKNSRKSKQSPNRRPKDFHPNAMALLLAGYVKLCFCWARVFLERQRRAWLNFSIVRAGPFGDAETSNLWLSLMRKMAAI